jgi:hypothetical protein
MRSDILFAGFVALATFSCGADLNPDPGDVSADALANVLNLFPSNGTTAVSSINFTSTALAGGSAQQDFRVTNSSGATVYFAVSTDAQFLTVTQDSDHADAGQSVLIHLVATLNDMSPGTNSGHLLLSANSLNRSYSVSASCSSSEAAQCTQGVPDNSSVTSTDLPSSGAFMVMAEDISLKQIDEVNSFVTPYMWFRGKTATQTQRDAMEEYLTGVGMPLMYRYERSLPSNCQGDLTQMMTWLNSITPRLSPIYELGRSLLPSGPGGTVGSRRGGVWEDPTSGRHYHFEIYAMKRVQATSLSASCSAACASNITPELLSLLNLRIEGGRCVAGASFSSMQPTESYKAAIGNGVAVVQSKSRMPGLNAEQVDLLDNQITPSHKAIANWFCGSYGPTPPDFENHHMIHMMLNETAKTESMNHFFTMKDHEFVLDQGWSPEDGCRLAIMSDEAHDQWTQAIKNGDWGVSRQAEDDHQNVHLCMSINDPNLVVRHSCGNTSIYHCPVQTCADMIAARFGSTQVYGTKR